MQGTYWFPFDKSYIIDIVLTPYIQSIASNLGTTADQYVNDYINLLYTNVIKTIQDSFNEVVVLRAYIIEEISNSLLSYDINLYNYQNYIVNKLIKKDDTGDQIDMYNQLVTDINKTLLLKKQLRDDKHDKKYIEPQQFIKLIDGLSYQDLKTGLNVEYYQDIVNEFYNTISNAVNNKDNTLDNIYYNSNKNYKMWNVSLGLITTILVFIWLYYSLKLIHIYKYILQDIGNEKKKAQDKYDAAIENKSDTDKSRKEIEIAANHVLFVNNESTNRTMNWAFKITVPVFILIFIIAMLFSYQRKSKAAFDFNSELIETNTMELKDILDDLKTHLDDLEERINPVDMTKKISVIEIIKTDDKTDIYDMVKKIIDKFEKCNYIIESQNSKLPFPYTEVVMNGFMLIAVILVFFYIYSQFKPTKRIFDIKELNRLKQEAIYADQAGLTKLKKEVEYLKACHNDDIDAIIYTLKIVFFMFIIMFLLFYSTKIISSTSEFKAGLYNSNYFENQTCYPI
jgi:hypothetical protein